ncbi:MAG TPA: gamma-glutamyltransferase [Verrucomicrobiae bacterium]|nr:gamma-glutamyltransferase [Verrucomicrobiae bacterium]
MQSRSTVMGKSGMVVSSQPRATLAGVEVLRRGGNAVDAAVATAAVLGVLEPMSIGIGGDAFALIYMAKSRKLAALDASGRSPYAADSEFFKRQGLKKMPETGIHSVTVPGAVAGWAAMREAYGTLSLSELLAAAIECAENGFPVGTLTSEHWHKSEGKLAKNPAAAAAYLNHGRAPRAGELFPQPDLARTLRQIAAEGPEAFYRGEIAEKIVRASERLGGLLSLKDFADHRSDWVEPAFANYRGYDIFELPPATQGIVALSMLKLIEPFELRALEHNGVEYLHLLIEAKKLAFADRDRHVADRDFMRVPWRALIAEPRLDAMRRTIERDRARAEAAAIPVDADTEYLAVADAEGNWVSFIQSLFTNFGSGVVAEGTGIALHNRGQLFSLDEDHPNCLASHKRPLHTLMPALILKDGAPWAALGLKGGHVQPQVQVQILLNLIDFGMTAQRAVDAPRFNHLSGLEVALEPEFPRETIADLEAKGHKAISGTVESFGGAHAIVRDTQTGVLLGGSDPRKEGCALGF